MPSAALSANPGNVDGFTVGQNVIYNPHGVGRIARTEVTSAMGACMVLEFASGLRVFVPFAQVKSALRPLSSVTESEEVLTELRRPGVERDARDHRARSEERSRVVRGGTRLEIAAVLRRLYAGKAPVSDTDAGAIRALEDILFPEIALVLGIPRTELEAEMRQEYPIFGKSRGR